MSHDRGAFEVSEQLRRTLREYLEATYHIRDESLIRERNELLKAPGAIAQEPYIEATPSYALGQPYEKLIIPSAAKATLSAMAAMQPGVGIYAKPYAHQAEVLEAVLQRGEDVIVASGTGSGKTESFLMPILSHLAMEGERGKTASLPGFRALLLYPMNALVNDQLGRIRGLLGDERVAKLLAQGRGRPVRFGSYTSRTPYPGERSTSKDNTHIRPIFEDFYIKYLHDAKKKDQLAELIRRGKWPSKDMEGFYGQTHEEQTYYRQGKRKGQPRILRHWNDRLQTQSEDRELLTRHEMQETCPDVLITNYSMLEYMLLRPIERSIFAQTKTWLAADPENELIIVLDEAHMYRGTGGAEVALLIRRLLARLGVGRDRVRFILTSASLGEGPEAERDVVTFAQDLTGLTSKSRRRFAVVRGVRDVQEGARNGTPAELTALASFDQDALGQIDINPDRAYAAVANLAETLQWPTPPSERFSLEDYLFVILQNWGLAGLLRDSVGGRALRQPDLSSILFGDDTDVSQEATSALLALGALAKSHEDDRVYLPTRLHLFYRGLPGLYACTNRQCDGRHDKSTETPFLLGRLYTAPHLQCSCAPQARVYELLTHRDCGAAFLKGYFRPENPEFLLHEPFSGVGDSEAGELLEIELLVERTPHSDAMGDCIEKWLDISSGRLLDERPDGDSCLPVFAPVINNAFEDRKFKACPVCLRTWRGRSKIMDLSTKGEAPFANIVKAQLFSQPPRCAETLEYPNGGRKVLLFSDGRQKAARLARDIPREVEWDSFRQTLALAVQYYRKVRDRDPRINENLYIAFVAVAAMHNLRLFDGDDGKELVRAIREFRGDFGSDLDYALEEWRPHIPPSYYRALLRQLGSSEFSLSAALVGYAAPAVTSGLVTDMQGVVGALAEASGVAIAVAYIDELLKDFAFGTSSLIPDSVRREAAGHPQSSWTHPGHLSKAISKMLATRLGCSPQQIGGLEEVLHKRLSTPVGGAYVLKENALSLVIDTKAPWYRCGTCTRTYPVQFQGYCVGCGRDDIQAIDPNTDPYARSRRGFLRNPVVRALDEQGRPQHVSAEEHTAQLSHRDAGVVFATTEKFELRFQDVIIDEEGSEDKGPIDVLSSTTTMELGVDIGSLLGVGLRNVPPMRENYQQRAGRAGRRGSAISTVVTYAQGGPHDNYYFHNPTDMVAGAPRVPTIKIANAKIAARHVNAFLIQTFFHEALDSGVLPPSASGKSMFSVLGAASEFFHTESDWSLTAFKLWVWESVLADGASLLGALVEWLPEGIAQDRSIWVRSMARALLDQLDTVAAKVPRPLSSVDDNDDEEDLEIEAFEDRRDELLTVLFDEGLLPSYAFPIDVCSFLIEERVRRGTSLKVKVKEMPQQSIQAALSEYAPGRTIVVKKVTYRSGGLSANGAAPSDPNRAELLFQRLMKYVSCKRCTFVQDLATDPEPLEACPVCGGPLASGEVLVPEVFHPVNGRALQDGDSDQEYTYASSAQFPLPLEETELGEWTTFGKHLVAAHALDRRLISVNKGNDETGDGFSVCDKCGAASVYNRRDPRTDPHARPYFVESVPGQTVPELCTGEFRQVFLGHQFQTDLLLLRINVEGPLARDVRRTLASEVLHDALRTLSEGLRLAASRELDIDPSEFQAGYRLVRTTLASGLRADLYLFDTLAGGAGYAEMAGQNLQRILTSTLKLLEECPGNCDTSCTECLRHYANKYWHTRLDRHLGADLLRFALYGQIPSVLAPDAQRHQLSPLSHLLSLDGVTCSSTETLPLAVSRTGRSVSVGVVPALIDESDALVVYRKQLPDAGVPDVLVSKYLLMRNLPYVYSIVRAILD